MLQVSYTYVMTYCAGSIKGKVKGIILIAIFKIKTNTNYRFLIQYKSLWLQGVLVGMGSIMHGFLLFSYLFFIYILTFLLLTFSYDHCVLFALFWLVIQYYRITTIDINEEQPLSTETKSIFTLNKITISQEIYFKI